MKAILIVRLSAIGDLVFASSLIPALRRRGPEAKLVWLAQAECAALLQHHPDLDAVIACPVRHWQGLWRSGQVRELWSGIATLRATLRAYAFDLALDLQGLFKSGLLTWLSGAHQRIGLGSREGSQYLMTEVLPRGGDCLQIASEYRFLAEQLGLPLETFQLAVHYGPAEAAFAEAAIGQHGLENGYAVFCPFTTRPQKHWFEERWGRLAQGIHAEFGLVPVLLGGSQDKAAARRIAESADESLVDLVGQTSLTEAAALIDRAALLVGVDTGLAHMGIALNTPSLLLFGSTRPYLETGRANARVLYHPLPCSPCRRRPSCNGRFECMRAIEGNEILQAASEILGA